MIRHIALNGNNITYDLSRKSVKRINLRISPKKGMCISAPKGVAIEKIEAFIVKNSDFVLKNLEKSDQLAKTLPKPLRYTDGETIMYLGDKKILRVAKGSLNTACIDGDFICLSVTDTEDFQLKEKVLKKYMREECIKIVTKICQGTYPNFQKFGIEFPQLKFRKMVSRWGICRPTIGTLTFNTNLVQIPISCIELVVMHEFTHFLHPNHSKNFYNCLASFMPDWVKREELLKKCSRTVNF